VVLVNGGGWNSRATDSALDRDDFCRIGVRWGLIPALMRAMCIEVVFIGGEDFSRVGFAEQQDVVGAVVSG